MTDSPDNIRQSNQTTIIVALIGAFATIGASIFGSNYFAGITAADKVEELTNPTVKVFPVQTTNSVMSQFLGEHQVCALLTVGTQKSSQACLCQINKPDVTSKEWQLYIAPDPEVEGTCTCQAACFNGLTESQLP
ncbi:hypothetical protein [Kiloniella majae]|uniref:hypothetical protein n=1 Tax=Kiloniella majae TaxID=1938558 RepID=UPI000A278C64|nr:hypothetical protein [Kiloniella majae]